MAQQCASSPALERQVKIAHGLAALEQRPELWMASEASRAFAARSPLDSRAFGLLDGRAEKVAAALVAMAEQSVILPLREYARLTKQADAAEAAVGRLPGVYLRLVLGDTIGERLAAYPYRTTKEANLRQREEAHRIAPEYGLTKEAVDRRCRLSVIRQAPAPKLATGFAKAASAVDADRLAEDYACYTVDALDQMAEFDPAFAATARLVICQNRAQ